jgi:hypothetical protein
MLHHRAPNMLAFSTQVAPMRPLDTATISFFHGTSSHAATLILAQGARNILDKYNATAAANDLWRAVLRHLGDKYKSASFLEATGCADPVGVSLLLENAAQGTQNGLMAYGSFYVTMNFEAACDYARRSPTGSELLSVLSMTIEALTKVGDTDASSIRERYPDLFSAIFEHGEPVVLELRGIESHRIAREDGDPDYRALVDLALEIDGKPGVQFAASFRIEAVHPTDIVAVYNVGQARTLSQSVPPEKIIPNTWLARQSSRT